MRPIFALPLLLLATACAGEPAVHADSSFTTEAKQLTLELEEFYGDASVKLLADGETIMSNRVELSYVEALPELIATQAVNADAYRFEMIDPSKLTGIWAGQERGSLELVLVEKNRDEEEPGAYLASHTDSLEALEALQSLVIASAANDLRIRDFINLCGFTYARRSLVFKVDGDGNGTQEAELERDRVTSAEVAATIPAIIARSQVEGAWTVEQVGSRWEVTLRDGDDILLSYAAYRDRAYADLVVAQASHMLGEQRDCQLNIDD